jgi:hypothetical protein
MEDQITHFHFSPRGNARQPSFDLCQLTCTQPGTSKRIM